MKKNSQKETLIKISVVLIAIIITVVYFIFAQRASIAAFVSKLYAFPDMEYQEAAIQALKFFNLFVLEYICSCLLLILNYVLYQKGKYRIAFIINITVTLLIVLKAILSYPTPYLLLLSSVIGIILSIITKHKN